LEVEREPFNCIQEIPKELIRNLKDFRCIQRPISVAFSSFSSAAASVPYCTTASYILND
jgi:hypothetical protein